MQITQQMWERFLRISEQVFDAMENGLDFASFEARLRDELNGLGQEVCKSVLEYEAQNDFVETRPPRKR